MTQNQTIYEVLRIQNAHPLFVAEHYERLQMSLSKMFGNYSTLSSTQFEQVIKNFVQKKEHYNGNIKISFASAQDYYIEISPHQYPTAQQYQEGVPTISLQKQRQNPTVKQWNEHYKQQISNLLAKTNAYEVLLLSGEYLMEGSKSNVFIVSNNTLITTPKSLVLSGVTRKKVIETARENKIPVSEKKITYPELIAAQAVFITGTSPKILPICQIDEHKIDVNSQIMRMLMQEYDKLIG